MVAIYISVGSNVDAASNVQGGVLALQRDFGVLRVSRVYESESVGFTGENFLNLVVSVDVPNLSVDEVSRLLSDIEDAHNRDRATPRFSPRTLDLDLLLYGDAVYRSQGINLPRDEITKNAFVLAPLAELAPNLNHPVLKQSYQSLWAAYDKESQRLWPIDFVWPDELHA